MKNNIYILSRIKYLVLLFLGLVMYSGCGKDAAPIIYDEYKDRGAVNPVVTGITPNGEAFAGYDVVTITGSNLVTGTDTAIVYFDNTAATIVEATPTQLKVKAPNTPKDSLMVRVSLRTGSKISDPQPYKLRAIMTVYYPFRFAEEPTAVTFDKQGNLYVSQRLNGVKKIDKSQALTSYAPRGLGNETNWTSLKFAYGPYGANGQLFGARKYLGIWKINPGVAPDKAPWVGPTQGIDKNVTDFDFDPQANMWVAGEGLNIFKVAPDLKVTKYKYATTGSKITSVRVFAKGSDLYLYVGGNKDGQEGIWRYKIVNGEIAAGSEELYFDFAAKYPGKSVLGLTFSEDGDLYVGTDGSQTILIVKSSTVSETLLPGVLLPKFNSFVWDPADNYLYYSRDKLSDETDKNPIPTLYKAFVFKKGAPYYGLTF